MTASWAVLVDRIAAVIDGEIITYSDIRIATTFRLADGDDKEVLKELINRKLLLREAKKFKVTETEADSEEIQRRFEEIKVLLTEHGFHEALREDNLSESDILNKLKDQAIVGKFIDFRINFFVVISDVAVKTYYDEHKNEFPDKALQDVSGQIKRTLFKVESDSRLEDFLNQLRKRAKILVNL